MSKIYSPKIVTDSLVMCLDASNNKSYPTDLPVKNGLVMWMDAADDTTFSYSSGTVVSQWRDKSGLNNHTSQATVLNQPSRSTAQNSRKIVTFDGTNDSLSTSNSLDLSVTHTIFAIASQTTGTEDAGLVSINNSLNNGLTLHNGSTYYGYYGDGSKYATSAITTSTSYIFTKVFKGTSSTTRQVYLNGTSATTTGVIANSDASGVIRLGRQSTYLNGTIAEVIIFNRELTATELKQVHTYLGQKWGISNTDRSIVDLSNNNNHGLLGNGTVANMPDYNYYNKSLTYNKGQSDTLVVTNSTSLKNNNTTIELYMKFNSAITSNTGDYIQFGLGSGNYGQYYFRNDSPNLTWNWFPASSATSSSAYAISNFSTDTYYLITLTGDSAGASKMYVNGIQVASAAGGISAVTTWTSNNLTIGGYFWDGYSNSDIALTRIYSRVLSAAEISQNYEAIKSRFANTIVQQGLVLNLDAGNPYSYAGAGTTWYDTSGNGNNGTFGASTAAPTYNSDNGGVIVFDGSDDYVSIPSNSNFNNGNNITVEAWVLCTNWSTYTHPMIVAKGINVEWILWKTNDAGYVGKLGWRAGGQVYTTTSLPNNTWVQCVGSVGGAGTKVYLNGVLESTVGNTIFTSGNVDVAIAAGLVAGSLSNPLGASVAITRIYNRQLTDAEVLQNYNATKGRFGL